MTEFYIGSKKVGDQNKPYCIAEVGINHNGDLARAKKMIEEAKKAGADAVKFQTFKAEEFCGDENQLFTYFSQGIEITESMLDMFKRYEFSKDEWIEIKRYCQKQDITFFSTPQNRSDLDLLLELGVSAIKIGSDDFTNLPLISSYANVSLPLILSCGMSNLAEVHMALEAAGWFKGKEIALMLCTSQYPTPPEDVNILKINTLKNSFPGLIIGFSDHTQDALAASLAVALGATIFEKHFTLDHNLPGPDHWFSDTPEQLGNWINCIHQSFKMRGTPLIIPTEKEYQMRTLARRSIVALKDIMNGDELNISNVGLRRPGNGLSPVMYDEILGSRASKNIKKGNLISLKDIKYDT